MRSAHQPTFEGTLAYLRRSLAYLRRYVGLPSKVVGLPSKVRWPTFEGTLRPVNHYLVMIITRSPFIPMSQFPQVPQYLGGKGKGGLRQVTPFGGGTASPPTGIPRAGLSFLLSRQRCHGYIRRTYLRRYTTLRKCLRGRDGYRFLKRFCPEMYYPPTRDPERVSIDPAGEAVNGYCPAGGAPQRWLAPCSQRTVRSPGRHRGGPTGAATVRALTRTERASCGLPQSRPNPRGGATLSSSARSRAQIDRTLIRRQILVVRSAAGEQ